MHSFTVWGYSCNASKVETLQKYATTPSIKAVDNLKSYNVSDTQQLEVKY